MGWDGPTSSHLLTNSFHGICMLIPPRRTCSRILHLHGVELSQLVPPAHKPSGIIEWDRHLPKTFSSHGSGTVPPRPTCSQTLSFHRAGRSHLVPTAHKPPLLCGGMIPPHLSCSQTFCFHGEGQSKLVPPAQKTLVFTQWDSPSSSYGVGQSHLVPPAQKTFSFH
jgi:hypothetical protein